MTRTFIRQDTQIYSSDVYDDTVTPSEANFETNPLNLEQDLNNLRSQVSNLLDDQAGNWYDDLNVPSALETGVQRGVNDLNDALHAVEKKRVLRDVHSLVDVTVPATQNFVVLGVGELPTQTTAAVGATTELGTVVAFHAGTFGTHSLDEVAGANAISPLNLMVIVDGSTRDPILSSSRTVYGLLQSEVSTNPHTLNTTTQQAQISFVRINATGDDLEAVPVADIENAVINYCTRERVRLEDLNEGDFLRGAIIDDAAGGTIDRQNAYTNQGATVVTTAANATLDLGTGLFWEIGDDGSDPLLTITEGSTGSTSTIAFGAEVDVFDNNALANDFATGATINSGGTRPIAIGETDGVIESTAGDLRVNATTELFLDDANQTGSTWAQTDGIKLSETTAEWDTFELNFGEVSILNAINQAAAASGRTRGQAVVTSTTSADTDVGNTTGGNLDVDLPDYSTVTFVDDVDVYLNGVLLRNGANAAANEDVYPGSTPANGTLRFEFTVKGTGSKPDVITMIVYGA